MTLQELVQQAARLYSDRRAVCFDECNNQPPIYCNYKTLVNTASELSHFLRLNCDFEGIQEVGLYCYPGINLPSWILGILQVPAAYAPIDPDSPPTLSTYFMKKCNLKYILVDRKQIDKFISSYDTLTDDTFSVEHNGVVLVKLDWKNTEANLKPSDGKEQYEKEKTENRKSPGSSSEGNSEACIRMRPKDCLAYALHTSGTTGLPKVVRVPHVCIVPNIQHFRVLFKITQEDVLFLASPLTFDPSVVEIFVALSSGASLLVVPTSVKMLPSKLAAVLFAQHRVTVLQATPTLLRRFGSQLIKSTVLSASTSLRVLALGGEAFPSLTVLRNWREEGNKTEIFNIYGITEVSSWATFYRIPEKMLNSTLQCDLPVQLGFPLLGTVVEVRDANGFTIQEGGRSRVCFLDDERTVPLGTMRATGDFVTVRGGEMFFLGRKDSQIKRHGKRLNTEHVQQVAEGLQQVESCAVTWCNQEKLILFVVSKEDVVKDDLFKELQKYLPSHAIPDELLLVDALPFTSHGKIDVLKLNKIYLNQMNMKSDCKLSEKEELWGKLQCLWKSILSLSEDPVQMPKESLFLQSGGDSLKAVRLLSEIENLVGTSVPGLLEIILSSSFSEIYSHILQTVFPHEVLPLSKRCATKRKSSDTSQEETSRKSLHQQADVPFNCDCDMSAFIALSRGSQILALSSTRLFTRSGKCPSPCPSDLTSQISSQNVRSVNPLPVVEKAEKPSYVAKVSDKEKPEIGTEKLKLSVRWKADTGKCVDASPLVVVPAVDKSSATVYIGSHSHRMMAVDLYSGKVKWEQILGDRIESSACISNCGKFIVVGCYNGLVYVLRSDSGVRHWIFPTQDTIKSSAAMDPVTGLLYIGSHDQHAYALDIYVRLHLGFPTYCQQGSCKDCPQMPTLCRGCSGAKEGLHLEAEVWRHSVFFSLFEPEPTPPLFCYPGRAVSGYKSCHWRQNLETFLWKASLLFSAVLPTVWQFSTGAPIFSSPCTSASEQEIFFGSHDCFIYCCNMKGQLQWKFQVTSRVYATPFTFQDHRSSAQTLLAAASTDGKLWVLESKSGQLQSVYELPGEAFSSPVVWESMLVIGCRNNYVYCLDLVG
ncbi:beta-alanine-activating enzyme isoform X2 [Tenrec ecaudatus]|uniref:beta-alanine-activating enzyme isoform X2 n=1 Tax=Tenrec ecaudatus TaxID=94439 RepID=UPI003F59BF18